MKTPSSSRRRKAEVKAEGQKRLRHVEGDAPLCLKIESEEKTQEERKVDQGRSSSNTGLRPTGKKTNPKEVTFTVLQKNTR